MRRTRAAVLLVLCVLVLAGCSSKSIVGSWQHDKENAQYTFNEDKTFTIKVGSQELRKGTYEIDEKEKALILTYNALSQTAQYEVSKKRLKLTSPDTGLVVTMTRIKTEK